MINQRLHEVRCDLGPVRDHFQQVGRALLEDIAAGRAVRRRDAVMIAREVLESEVVRAAVAVLEADDARLCARVVELLRIALGPSVLPLPESADERNSSGR